MFRSAASGGIARQQRRRLPAARLGGRIFRRDFAGGSSGPAGFDVAPLGRKVALSSESPFLNLRRNSQSSLRWKSQSSDNISRMRRISLSPPTFGQNVGVSASSLNLAGWGNESSQAIYGVNQPLPAIKLASFRLDPRWQSSRHHQSTIVRWSSTGGSKDKDKKGTKGEIDDKISEKIDGDSKKPLSAARPLSDAAEHSVVKKEGTLVESTGKDLEPTIEAPKEGNNENEKKSSKSEDDSITIRVGPTLKHLSEEWNDSDRFYLVMILLAVAAVAVPVVVRQMRKSDSTYEDIDPEDPVSDLAKMMRDEYFGTPSAQNSLALDVILADLLRSKELQDALSELVSEVIQSPKFKQSCQVLLHELWTDLINDPETTNQVIHLLQHAIQDKRVMDAANTLVIEVVNDKEVMDELIVLLQRLGSEEKVQLATQALLVESAHNALNDPEILDHSMEFATDVVGDDVVQRTAGEALYNTFSYAVRPFLSLALASMGVGLIVVSIMALRNASATEEEVDRMLEATIDAVQSGTVWSFLSKVLSTPFGFLVSCKNAVVFVVLSPYYAVNATLSALFQVGNATITTTGNVVYWIFRLPGRAASSVFSLVSQANNSLVGAIFGGVQRTGNAISSSFIGDAARGAVALVIGTKMAIFSAIQMTDDTIVRAYFYVSDALGYTKQTSMRLLDMAASFVASGKDSMMGRSSAAGRSLTTVRSRARRSILEWDRSARNRFEQLRIVLAQFLALFRASSDM